MTVRRRVHEGSRDTRAGIIVSLYPDYCHVAGGGVCPFTIHARQWEDINTAATVRQRGRRSHTSASLVMHCRGSEAGVGIHSGTRMGVCRPLTWSATARINGHGVVRDGDLWLMNNANSVGKLHYIEDIADYDYRPVSGAGRFCARKGAEHKKDERPDRRADISGGSLPEVPDCEDDAPFFIPAGGQRLAKPLAEGPFQVAQASIPLPGGGPVPFYIPPGSVFEVGSARNREFTQWLAPRLERAARELGLSVKTTGIYIWHLLWHPGTVGPGVGEGGAVDGILEGFGGSPASARPLEEKSGHQSGFRVTGVERAAAAGTAETAEDARVRCRDSACPVPMPGQTYRGGAYWCVKLPWRDGLDAHHMPARAYSHLPSQIGPAIQMRPEHHRETASNPWNTRNVDYSEQIVLLAQGRFMDTFEKDISDAYDAVIYAGGRATDYAMAMAQVRVYVDCLRRLGLVR